MIFEKIQLEANEEILSVIRRHWFYVFKQCVFIALLVFLPLLGLLSFLVFVPQSNSVGVLASYAPHIVFLYAFWLLINVMLLASIWTDYYLDIWCITNRRIIKIDQVSLFNRETGSFRLERMQDVNVEINGILATFLDYGTIHVQTASADLEEFKATYLPRPQEIKSQILKAADDRMEPKSL